MQRSWILGLLIAATLFVITGNETEAQGTRFRASWLFLKRDSDAASSNLIVGPDTFSSSANFNYESGYRLFFSQGTEAFDVEFQYSQLLDWEDQKGARLLNPLSFDDEFNNPFVVGAPPANVLAFNNSLYTAAQYNGGAPATDETTEGELLDAFSGVVYKVDTTYRDFNVTLKTTRLNWWRFGIGYRHIQFNEANGLLIGGNFSAIDADDGAIPGDPGNGPNDILSDEALRNAGLTLAEGGGNGFAFGDVMFLNYDSQNRNSLNGVQLTFDGSLYDGSIFALDTFANIGLYHNQITAKLLESYFSSGMNSSVYQTGYRETKNDLAWATQLGLRGYVKLTDNWKFLLGYEFIYIDGLALGPNQPRLTPLGGLPVGSDQSAFLHGGQLGFEAVW